MNDMSSFDDKENVIKLTPLEAPSRYHCHLFSYSPSHFPAQRCCTPLMLHRQGPENNDYGLIVRKIKSQGVELKLIKSEVYID
jgi:hypothetical protein